MQKADFVQIALNVLLCSIFICAFYFIYGAKLEGRIVESECKSIVDKYVAYFKSIYGDSPASTSICEKITLDKNEAEDDAVSRSNNMLLKKAVKTFTIGSIAISVFIVCLLKIGRPLSTPFNVLLKRSLLNLTVVALVEYIFLKYIIGNYINIDENIVNGYVIQAVKNYK